VGRAVFPPSVARPKQSAGCGGRLAEGDASSHACHALRRLRTCHPTAKVALSRILSTKCQWLGIQAVGENPHRIPLQGLFDRILEGQVVYPASGSRLELQPENTLIV